MHQETLIKLNDKEMLLVHAKRGRKNQLGFALLLKYYQLEGRYPTHLKYIDPVMLLSLSSQLDIDPSVVDHYDWESRSTERHRQEVRNLLGYRTAKVADIKCFKTWLNAEVFPAVGKTTSFIEHAYEYFREQRIEPFAESTLWKYIKSAHSRFEQSLFDSIYVLLSDKTKGFMKKLLTDSDFNSEEEMNAKKKKCKLTDIKFRHLKKSVPGAKLKHVAFEIVKIQAFAKITLPTALLETLSKKIIKKYYQRIMSEPPSSIRKHEPSVRYATIALFCYRRSQIIIDDVVDLFLQLVHKMQTSAENFVTRKIVSDVKHVDGKFDILYLLARTSLSHPKGIIEDTIYSEVDEATLEAIVKELDHKGKWYGSQVNKKIRSLYSHASRKELLTLLGSVLFLFITLNLARIHIG